VPGDPGRGAVWPKTPKEERKKIQKSWKEKKDHRNEVWKAEAKAEKSERWEREGVQTHL
jgi:hypothetical protein